MSELYTKSTNNPLTKKYVGKSVGARELLYIPFRILHYELTKSRFNKDSQMLVAQVIYVGEDGKVVRRFLRTEAVVLVGTIKTVTKEPPYDTKIVANKNGVLLFTKLNKPEQKKLEESLSAKEVIKDKKNG